MNSISYLKRQYEITKNPIFALIADELDMLYKKLQCLENANDRSKNSSS